MSRRVPSLFGRLIGLIALVLAGGLVVLGWASWIYARIAADEAYDRLLVGAALQIAESVATEPGRITVDPPISAFETLAMAVSDRVFYRVVDPAGETLTGQEDLASARRGGGPRREPSIVDGTYRGFPVRIATLGRYVTGPDVAGWVEITVAQTIDARLDLARDLTLKAMLLVLGISGVAMLAVVVAVRRGLRPLDRVEAVLAARDPKDLRPLDVETPREIRPLIGAINHFLRRLSERIGGMERFVADAAHQIRTPLTALSAQVELLSSEPRAERRRTQIARVRERTDQLGRLTNQLLSHAMVIHRREVVRLEPVDLVAISRAALAETVPLSLDREVRIGFESESATMPVLGDRVSIREAISNLIHNAIRHGAPGYLAVSLAEEAGGYRIRIEDDGPGVPPAQWNDVVLPFVRGVESETHAGGSGLGLAIASDVAVAHGGRLSFGRSADGYFAVDLWFARLGTDTAGEKE
ncbi:MAG TPA: sensor histidine kinase [Rhabdaerophilum sp.]|nr:sensor histidine kinase [Rhabdaerophilum sp.]